MPQPIKNIIKPVKKVKKKRVKNSSDSRIPPKKNISVKGAWRKNIKHQEYGTSKLEERFAHNFLKKLGVPYIYQYKADSIGRYFDFRICDSYGKPVGPIIEVQGSYWHGDSRIYEEKDLDKTQLRDIKIDEYKRSWCKRNGITLLYVWELDINNDPEGVMNYLKEKLSRYINMNDKNNRNGRRFLLKS